MDPDWLLKTLDRWLLWVLEKIRFDDWGGVFVFSLVIGIAATEIVLLFITEWK